MSFLLNWDSDNVNGQYRGFSGRVDFVGDTRQFALAIAVPAPAPMLKVVIPWHLTHAAGYIPGLPKLYLDAGEVLSTAQGDIDGTLVEVAPASVDTTTVPGNAIAEYHLSTAQTGPYAGLSAGTNLLSGGMVLRTNVHKGAPDFFFPSYSAADWITFPAGNETGLFGVTVGNDTGPITVEAVAAPARIAGHPRASRVIFTKGRR